jgi:tryptophan-rich sensory protein
VAVFTFVALILAELGVERASSDETYYQEHGWPKLLGFAVAAALVWMLSNHVEKRPARVVIDKQTGQELTLQNKHDLFFVPLRYWPAVLLLAGLGFVLFG